MIYSIDILIYSIYGKKVLVCSLLIENDTRAIPNHQK